MILLRLYGLYITDITSEKLTTKYDLIKINLLGNSIYELVIDL